MPSNLVDYDHVAGVSIGAINASIFSTFPRGHEQEAVDKITELYTTYTTADLFSFYTPMILAPFKHNSMADFSPCMEVLRKTLADRPFQRKVSLLTCDLNTAQPLILDETMSNEERIELIIASASIPFAFQPREIEDMFLVDGGMFSNVAIGDPIERCREEGFADEDIIVDVLLCYESPWVMDEWDSENLQWQTAWDFYQRRHAISKFYFNTEEVQRLYRGYDGINFRLVI